MVSRFFILQTLLALLWCVSAGGAMAQPGSAGLLPEGQTLVSLSVTERTTVVPDQLVATLRVEREDRDSEALQRAVNAQMAEALALLDAEGEEILVSTGRYSVYQYQRQPQGGRSDSIWRATQSLTLETGTAHDQLRELAGRLQDAGLVMSRLDWQLSNARAAEVRDGLLEAAVTRAREQVQRAGEALGRTQVEIAEISLEPEGNGGPVMMRSTSAMVAAESAPPSARPGETEVTLTIRVRAVAR